MIQQNRDDRMVWLDLETLGFSPASHAIIEIGIAVTEPNLDLVASRTWLVRPTGLELERADKKALEIHERSGLLDECVSDRAVDPAVAEQHARDFILAHVSPNKSPLCGNSVWFDHGFLVAQMPRIREILHYRIVDVSTVKELARRWKPSLFERASAAKKLQHRALEDVFESIAEARTYGEDLFALGGSRS